MPKERFSRREILQKCAAFGSLTVLPSLSLTDIVCADSNEERAAGLCDHKKTLSAERMASL